MVGQDYDTALAALKAKGIVFQEEAAGAGKKVSYGDAGESVALEFTPWPKDPDAPASAWEANGSAAKHLVLTHILDVAPGSDARRVWVRTFEKKDGKRWAYLPEKAAAERPAEDRAKYPVAAFLQWPPSAGAAPVTFLFKAARAAGTPPGSEATALDILLENPHRPRRF